MTHREEIEFGRRIEHHEMVAYRCAHNHTWYILGPHVWCRCQWRAEDGLTAYPRVLCLRGGGVGVHECDPVCDRQYHRAYRLSTYVEVVGCDCGARTKGPARIDRATLRSAAAAHLLGGMAAVGALRAMGSVVKPRCRTVSLGREAVFNGPTPFPVCLCLW